MNNDPLGLGGNFIEGRLPSYTGSSRAKAPTKKKKGFWQDQISTGGSIGGAAGGAALGAAAGSVVPVVGTAIGGLLGAVLGGALGGASGQRVENAVVGDDLNQDVMKEALWGGATGVGPIKAAMIAKGAGGALIKGAGGSGIRTAVEKASTATPIRDALGRGAAATSDNLAVKGLRLNPSQTTNFKDKFGEDVTTTIRNNNLIGRNADEIADARKNLNGQFDEIVVNAPDVSKADVMNRVKTVAAELAKAGPSDSKVVAKNLIAEAEASLAGFGDTIPASAVNGLRRNFDSLVNYTEKTANPSRYNVNKRMADALRGTLQNTADSAGMTAGGRSFKALGGEISKLSQLQKIAARQEGLGRGSGPIGLRDALSMGGTGAAGGLAGGPVGALAGAATGMVASKVANNPGVLRAATRGLDNVSGRLGGASGNPRGLGGFVGRGVTGEAIDQTLWPTASMDMEQPVSLDEGLAPEADIAGYYGDEGMTEDGASGATNPFGVSREEVAQGMLAAMQAGDKTGYSQLKDLYDMIGEFESEGAGKGLNSTAASSLAMSDNGLNTLTQLEQLYGAAGGGSGKIGGRIKSVLGDVGLNDDTASYEALSASSVSQLAKAINGGGQVSDADAAVIIRALPKVTDSPEVAKTKFAALKQRLATARQNTMLYNSGVAEPTQPTF